MKIRIGVFCMVNGESHIREMGTTKTLCGKALVVSNKYYKQHMEDAQCNLCRKVVGLPSLLHADQQGER